MPDPEPLPLGILLISGTHERAHYAFVVAAAAAAMGRPVTIFATNDGCRALLEDWSRLDGAGRDAAVRQLAVAGLAELREAAAELGVRRMACDAGMRLAGIEPSELAQGVEVAGIPTFLAAIGHGQIVTL